MAPMDFSDSEVYIDKTCSKTCLQNYETLKKQCDDLIVKLNQTEFTAATYKTGLATVEAQQSHLVPLPHPLIYNRPKKLDLSYSGLDEFKEPEFKGYCPKIFGKSLMLFVIKKSDNSKENSEESLVEEQVSQDTSSFVESSLNVDKETVFPVNKKPQHDDKGFVDSGCSRHMTGNIAYLSDFRKLLKGYGCIGGGAYGG
ncbi:hypothetical protein Tco_1430084 [Tanacetum coccineum]